MNVGSLPLVGALELGQATFARGGISRAVRHALPSSKVAGVRVQKLNVLESRLFSTGGGPWVVFNVHLPAFDDGSLRRRQLVEILELLQAEYESGSSSSRAATGTCVSPTRRSHTRRRRRTRHGCATCRPG